MENPEGSLMSEASYENDQDLNALIDQAPKALNAEPKKSKLAPDEARLCCLCSCVCVLTS